MNTIEKLIISKEHKTCKKIITIKALQEFIKSLKSLTC